MARAALGLGIRDLSRIADVGSTTITRFEHQQGGTITSTVKALQKALEDQGVIFLQAEKGLHAGGVAMKEGFENDEADK